MMTAGIVTGIGLALLALGIGWATVERGLTRWRARRRDDVDPQARRNLHRRVSDLQRKARFEEDARLTKPS